VAKGHDSLELLSQSTWVGPGRSVFQLDLAVTASDPANETLAVDVYPLLTTRSQFQQELAGTFPAPGYQGAPVPLTDLPSGPGGGAELDLPVNSPAGGLSLGMTGVYPVQVFLQRQGLTEGKPLTTFLVYAANGARSFNEHLGVSLVVPITAKVQVSRTGAIGNVPAGAASLLQADIAQLAAHKAAVTVQGSASTLEAMEESGGATRAAVSQLRDAVVRNGDELLPTTTLPVDVGSLVSSGLQDELAKQLASGDATLTALLGTPPSPNTWVLSGGVDHATLGALSSMGVTQVAVPAGALSQLPAEYQRLTFAQPAKLEAGANQLLVFAADSELAARIAEASSRRAVLVANQVLAELAMIDLEAPNDPRAVVMLPPAGTTIDPTFLSVVLSGLEGNPLLRAVTLQQAFGSVPVATSGTRPLVRQLVGPPSAGPLVGASQLGAAQSAVSDAGQVFGKGVPFVAGLQERLLVSTSSVWSGHQRSRIIAGVERSAEEELHKVRLPSSTSITLTSRRGRLPLTLISGTPMAAHVRLVLSSEELSFLGGSFPGGSCTAYNPGSEECDLHLVHASTTFEIPVTVRTPGAFQLSLEIETPGGSFVAAGSDTIRSTAVSGVGLLLMVGAALFLVVWWVRNARHGRRSRRLVPRPAETVEDGRLPV
jgi:hypothetical protein